MKRRTFRLTHALGAILLTTALLAAGCDASSGGADPDGSPDVGIDAGVVADLGGDIPSSTDLLAPGDVDDVSEDVATPPEMPHALCGMPDYDLLPAGEVGALLAWEEIPFWTQTGAQLDALLSLAGFTALSPVDYGTRMLRFRYTTQDRGTLVEATALLCLPARNDMPDAPFPISLHTHGTTGTTDACAPTHPDREMADPAITAGMTALGFITVAPDYIGLCGFGGPCDVRHAYLTGEQLAVGSWDAVRAALLLIDELGSPVTASGEVVPWGPSQGGHGALFVQRYAPYYAPEFSVPATVALVAPVDIVPLISQYAQQMGAGSGLFTVSLAGWYLWYGEQASLSEVFTNDEPYYFADSVTELIYPEEGCGIDVSLDPNEVSVEMFFTPEMRAAVTDGLDESFQPWSCYIDVNSPSSEAVPPLDLGPILAVFGEDDELVLPAGGADAVASLCALGHEVETLACASASHTEAPIWSLPQQRDWIRARLAGEPLNSARVCTAWAYERCVATPDDVVTE